MEPVRRGARLARIAAGHAQRAPVRGPVAGPGKAGRVHKGLRDQQRESVCRQHVFRQSPQAQAEHPRSEIRDMKSRQDHKAGILGDEVQTADWTTAVGVFD